jgi:hypothetical protein
MMYYQMISNILVIYYQLIYSLKDKFVIDKLALEYALTNYDVNLLEDINRETFAKSYISSSH